MPVCECAGGACLPTPCRRPTGGYRGWAEGEESVDEQILTNRVTTTYLGDRRVHLAAGDRTFEADQRTELERPGAGFCPLELVAAALGA